MEAQSLGSHQHSWWFSFVFLYEKNWLEAIIKTMKITDVITDPKVRVKN
ncbi:hypothetical protein HO452_10690 [Streptococcus suis]|nr:hypothetical protein [Streptococcus suis]